MSKVMMYKRQLKLDVPAGQTVFLWGPRKVGKTTYLKQHYPKSVYYDFLLSDVYFKFLKSPHIFREEVLALSKSELKYPIIIDEVQRIPMILNEIHWLIENTEAYFILCGSSARKLKKSHANLLGGRAWRFHCLPLTSKEVHNIDLCRVFNDGLIPSHYLSPHSKRFLDAYISDYLTQEVKQEGLVRNLPAFTRFLDIVGFSNGQMINFSNISKESGVDIKTVQEYFHILEDTMLGYMISPYSKHVKRQVISSCPKFYLCDVGIANRLSKTSIQALKGSAAGGSFEHFIFMEIMAYKLYMERDFEIRYWRTKTGLEVDFICGNAALAIEVKLASQVGSSELRGLIAFKEEHPDCRAIVVSQDQKERLITTRSEAEIKSYPWPVFLKKLWKGELI